MLQLIRAVKAQLDTKAMHDSVAKQQHPAQQIADLADLDRGAVHISRQTIEFSREPRAQQPSYAKRAEYACETCNTADTCRDTSDTQGDCDMCCPCFVVEAFA